MASLIRSERAAAACCRYVAICCRYVAICCRYVAILAAMWPLAAAMWPFLSFITNRFTLSHELIPSAPRRTRQL
jgi:hypothetical protein